MPAKAGIHPASANSTPGAAAASKIVNEGISGEEKPE
jgi:hypothetical protein